MLQQGFNASEGDYDGRWACSACHTLLLKLSIFMYWQSKLAIKLTIKDSDQNVGVVNSGA